MNRMENAKKKYDEITITEELSQRIMWEVERANKKKTMYGARKRQHLRS